MKIRGNLELSQDSEVRNLKIEKVSGVEYSSSEQSRIVFDVVTKKIYLNDGEKVVSILSSKDSEELFKTVQNYILEKLSNAGEDVQLSILKDKIQSIEKDYFSKELLENRLDTSKDNIKKTFYTYTSIGEDSVHIINHNLGCKYVHLTVIDPDTDEMFFPLSIKYIDKDNARVEFSSPRHCVVICSAIGENFTV